MRAVRRAVALAALLPCFAVAAPATLTPAPAQAAPKTSGAVQRRAPVGLAFTKVSPKTVRENSRIEISGVAKNRGFTPDRCR